MNLSKLKIEPIYEYIDVNIIKSIPKFEDIEKFLLDVDFLIEYYLWKYKDTFSSKEKLSK